MMVLLELAVGLSQFQQRARAVFEAVVLRRRGGITRSSVPAETFHKLPLTCTQIRGNRLTPRRL